MTPSAVKRERGFTIVELLVSLVIAATILAAMTGLVNNVLTTETDASSRNDAMREARFAMRRMVAAVADTNRLLLPLADNPNTNWREHVREQTVPAVAPEGDSALATAVLAVSLGASVDLDMDGVADADNDRDGAVDEDPGWDMSLDGVAGIAGIDDDGDGTVDEGNWKDDDEDGSHDEDATDDIDNDGDGAVDEDEGGADGSDWLDPLVYYLNGSALIERRPNLKPGDGNDYSEFVVADNVTYLAFERVPVGGGRSVLVNITLEVTMPNGETANIDTRVRVGGGG